MRLWPSWSWGGGGCIDVDVLIDSASKSAGGSPLKREGVGAGRRATLERVGGRNVGDGRADRRRRRARGGSRRLCAPPIRRERRSRRVGRRARRRRRTRHPEPLGTFGGSPSGDKRVREPTGQIVAGSATRARARVRTEIVEVAAGKGRVVRGACWPPSIDFIARSYRRPSAPRLPRQSPTQPQNCTPLCRGVPLRGGNALSVKGGAHLNAQEPHEVGRRFTVHRPSIDEIRKKTRKRPRTTERPKSAKKISGFFFALALQAESGRDECHTNCDESSVYFTGVDYVAGRVPPRGRAVPLHPLPVPLLPSLPLPPKKNVLTRCNWARVPSRRRCSPTVPT